MISTFVAFILKMSAVQIDTPRREKMKKVMTSENKTCENGCDRKKKGSRNVSQRSPDQGLGCQVVIHVAKRRSARLQRRRSRTRALLRVEAARLTKTRKFGVGERVNHDRKTTKTTTTTAVRPKTSTR